MATPSAEGSRACPNGHAILSDDPLCPTCGAATDVKPASVGPTAWIAAVLILATVVVGLFVASRLVGGSSVGATTQGGGTFATACDGAAQKQLTIGNDATTTYGLICFRVKDHSTVTIDASPVGPATDLRLSVSLATGEVIAEADAGNRRQPTVEFEAQPGTYAVDVSRVDGLKEGSVTISSSAASLPGAPTSVLPTLDQCPTLGGATIDQSGTQARAMGEPYTCLAITAAAFTKIGAVAVDPIANDLTLAVYRFDSAGVAQFIRSVDDTFGNDPELNLDLASGTYLIEASSYSGGQVGAYSVYVDTTGTYFRTSPVSSGLATLRPSSCATLPAVTIGTPLTVGAAGQPLACLTLDAQERLVIMAATHAGQDLTLEIVGFDSAGMPVRYDWADDDVFGEDPNSQDPRVDLALPAGTYVLGVNEFWGEEVAHDFVLTVKAGSAR
jgi:hypothetical protein